MTIENRVGLEFLHQYVVGHYDELQKRDLCDYALERSSILTTLLLSYDSSFDAKTAFELLSNVSLFISYEDSSVKSFSSGVFCVSSVIETSRGPASVAVSLSSFLVDFLYKNSFVDKEFVDCMSDPFLKGSVDGRQNVIVKLSFFPWVDRIDCKDYLQSLSEFGLYFLGRTDGDAKEIVYVGKSRQIGNRVKSHFRHFSNQFDCVRFVFAEFVHYPSPLWGQEQYNNALSQLESEFISRFTPVLNIRDERSHLNAFYNFRFKESNEFPSIKDSLECLFSIESNGGKISILCP